MTAALDMSLSGHFPTATPVTPRRKMSIGRHDTYVITCRAKRLGTY